MNRFQARQVLSFSIASLLVLLLANCTSDAGEQARLPTITPIQEDTNPDPSFATATSTRNSAATATNQFSIHCKEDGGIVFVATDSSKGDGAAYLLCQAENELIPILPISANESITGLDISADGRLVYARRDVSSNEWHLSVQLNEMQAAVQVEDVDFEPIASPSWILDDTRILFIQRNTPNSLSIFDIETKSIVTVFEEYTISNLNVSSDGKMILFTVSTGQPNNEPSTIVADLVCNYGECNLIEQRQVNNIGNIPVWTRDSTSIVSIIYGEEQNQRVILLRATRLDGTIEQEINISELQPLDDISKIISAGDRFVLIGNAEGTDNLYILSIEDYSVERLTDFMNSDLAHVTFFSNN